MASLLDSMQFNSWADRFKVTMMIIIVILIKKMSNTGISIVFVFIRRLYSRKLVEKKIFSTNQN